MNGRADLVRPDDFGIESRHYYFLNRDRFDLSLDELRAAGVSDERCRIGRELIEPLQEARRQFAQRGYEMIIKDGYRSPELYRLIYAKRTQREGGAHFGRENTDQLLNMDRMIHARGDVVDIDLVHRDGRVVRFRDGSDGVPAHKYGFYAGRKGPQAREYQRNQDLMKEVMFNLGFVFGTLVEYWHFELPAGQVPASKE